MIDIALKATTVCFTGHRPSAFGGYDETSPLICLVKAELTKEIEIAISQGFDTFISGAAIGVDTWAAEIVLELREHNPNIELVLAIPFKEQCSQWPQAAQNRWAALVTKADMVQYVSPPVYAAWKMSARNEWMVDNASLVIAVWNGDVGGTGNCIKYAEDNDMEIVRINPNTLS